MLHISDILTVPELHAVRARIAQGAWIDGRATAGHLSARVKHNRQLGEDDRAGLDAGAIVLAALARSGSFASAALPQRIAPPLFNRYGIGDHYGDHIDGAIRPMTLGRMRLDLSATLFLSAPDSYDGGELVIRAAAGDEAFKLPAGDLLLYPAGAVHHVAPVTGGEREACFFWVQSMVRSAEQRDTLLSLDRIVQRSAPDTAVEIAQIYHNLLRMWADP